MVAPVPTLNQTPYNDLKDSINNYDFMDALGSATAEYYNSLGNYFYLILWGAVFAMLWIRQGKITIPSTIGFIFGGVIISMLPESYQMGAQVIVLLGGIVVIYILYSERR